MDRELRYLYFNAAAHGFTGVSLESARGKRITEVLPDVENTERYRCYRRVLETGEPCTLDDVAPGGVFGERHFKTQCFRVGEGIGIIFTDITKEKEVEEELRASREDMRSLAAHIEVAREDERKRIAREVHDDLGQVLTSIDLDIRSAKRNHHPADSEIERCFASISSAVSQALDSVHRIATELRPGILDHLGLSAALEWLVDDAAGRAAIKAECRIDITEGNLSDAAKTALFRISQEALTNAIRHSKARSVFLGLEEDEDSLCLRISDDGIGLASERIASSGSFGILGMQERARELGGSFAISSPGRRGVRIEVRIPRS
jgi:signal transduction histidine kinase